MNLPEFLRYFQISKDYIVRMLGNDLPEVSPTTGIATDERKLVFSDSEPTGGSYETGDLVVNSSGNEFDPPAYRRGPAGWIAWKAREFISLSDVCPAANGTTDDYTLIQEVFASGQRRIVSPAFKTYRITDQLTLTNNQVVVDLANSTLLLDDATGLKNHLKIGDGVTQYNNIKIFNTTFSRNQVATGGYAIDTDYLGLLEVRNCRIYGNSKIYRGVKLYRTTQTRIGGNYIDGVVDIALYLEGLNSTTNNKTIDSWIFENRIDDGVTAIKTWDFVEGLFFRNNICYSQSGDACILSASSNANGLISFKIQESEFDSASGRAIYAQNINNLQITDGWISTVGSSDCVVLDSAVNTAVVAGNQMYPNAVGLNVNCGNATVIGNTINGGTDSISVGASAINSVIAVNTASSAQRGVVLDAACTNIGVRNNIIHSMSVGTISGTGGTGCTIIGNQGDATIGSPAAITPGASPYTYTAGVRPECVFIRGGTISDISIGGNTIATSAATSGFSVMLAPNQSMVITYAVAPTMTRNRL